MGQRNTWAMLLSNPQALMGSCSTPWSHSSQMYSSNVRLGHTCRIPSLTSSVNNDSTENFSVLSFFLLGFFFFVGSSGGGGSFAAASFLAFAFAILSFFAYIRHHLVLANNLEMLILSTSTRILPCHCAGKSYMNVICLLLFSLQLGFEFFFSSFLLGLLQGYLYCLLLVSSKFLLQLQYKFLWGYIHI